MTVLNALVQCTNTPPFRSALLQCANLAHFLSLCPQQRMCFGAQSAQRQRSRGAHNGSASPWLTRHATSSPEGTCSAFGGGGMCGRRQGAQRFPNPRATAPLHLGPTLALTRHRRGGGGWHVAFGALFSSAVGGAHWPIALRCPSLGHFLSIGGGAHQRGGGGGEATLALIRRGGAGAVIPFLRGVMVDCTIKSSWPVHEGSA